MMTMTKWFAPLAMIAMLGLAACETTPSGTGAAGGKGAAAEGTTGATGAETAGGVESSAIQPGSQEDLVQNVGDRVFFALDSAVLLPEARKTLELQAEWMKRYPNVAVTIEGHADERGTREYNLALGERRAAAVVSYLVALGIDPSRISSISYGKERPYALGHDEEAWRLNRRAVTVVN